MGERLSATAVAEILRKAGYTDAEIAERARKRVTQLAAGAEDG